MTYWRNIENLKEREALLPPSQEPATCPCSQPEEHSPYLSWLRNYATSQKVAGSSPDEVVVFFNWPDPSSLTVALGSTQPLRETSTRNLPGGKGPPGRKADNLTAICEPNV
jgi:hypothetical protein